MTLREKQVRGGDRLHRKFATKDRYSEHQKTIVKNAR